MKKLLSLTLAVAFGALAWAQAPATTQQGNIKRSEFNTSGRSISAQELRQVIDGFEPAQYKSDFDGRKTGIYRLPQTAESVEMFAPPRLLRGQDPVSGETRYARALMIYSDLPSDQWTSSIVEVPLSGAPSQFNVLKSGVMGREMAVHYGKKFMTSYFYEGYYTQYCYVYDDSTLDQLKMWEYYRADLQTSSSVYDPTTGNFYGCYAIVIDGQYQWAFGYMTTVESYNGSDMVTVVKIMGADSYHGMMCTADGKLYGINAAGTLFTIDKTTGNATKVGETGCSNKYATSGFYDDASGKIYYVTSNDFSSALYVIDPATAKATHVYDMPNGEQLLGLYVPGVDKPADVPAAATDLELESVAGNPTAKLTFTAPSTLNDGTAVSGDVDFEVFVGGRSVKAGTTQYGKVTEVEFESTANAEVTIAVVMKNSAGTSEIASIFEFVGTPKPRAPYFTGVSFDKNSHTATVSWAAPNNISTGYNGGVVNTADLEFVLTRYPDGKVERLPFSTTSAVQDIEQKESMTVYWYTLTIEYHGVSSVVMQSQSFSVGDYVVPPYFDDCKNKITLAYYSQIGTATDDTKWDYVGAVTGFDYGYFYHGDSNRTEPTDSYFFMPPVKLEGGKTYNFSFKAASTNVSWRNERVAVYMGRERTIESVRQQQLMAPTEIYSIRDEGGQDYNIVLKPQEDGIYHIAFHHCSDPDLRFLYLGQFRISEPLATEVPAAVGNLQVTADPSGASDVTIAFDRPTKTVSGADLTGEVKVRINRDGKEIYNDVVAGDKFIWHDLTPVNGNNNYVVTPYNESGDGSVSQANVYVGYSRPVNPGWPVAWVGSNSGEALVTWPPVTEDERGTPLTSESVYYEVQRQYYDEDGALQRKVVGEHVVGTSFTEQVVAPTDEPEFVSYWVRARTAGGYSQWVSSDAISLGKTYEMPFEESFTDASLSCPWFSKVFSGGAGQWTVGSDASFDNCNSVDGDNGLCYFRGSQQNTNAIMYSPVVTVASDAKHPVASLYYYSQGEGCQNKIGICANWGEGMYLIDEKVCSPEWGWKRIDVDLSNVKGMPIQIAVQVRVINMNFVVFDKVRVYDRPEHDIHNVTVSGPTVITAGDDAEFTITYENDGLNAVKGCKVSLYRDGVLVGSVENNEELASEATASVKITDHTNSTYNESCTYYAVVESTDDEIASNNKSQDHIAHLYFNDGFPVVTGLTANREDNTVKLAWNEPEMENLPLQQSTETFEGFTPFATTFAPWTTIDRDGLTAAQLTNTLETPGITGKPVGFFVQDASAAGFKELGDPVAAYSGTKYMASLWSKDESGKSKPNDDWLISPELSGERQVLSFLASSVDNSYKETFEIYTSSTGNAISDFNLIGRVVDAKAEWIEYTGTLPEGTKYMAIRCISNGQLMLKVDDVTMTLKSAPQMELSIMGYNVYRDGVKINDELLESPEFIDTTADGGAHEYVVTAVYDKGESNPSEKASVLSGLSLITAPGVSVHVQEHDIIVEGAADRSVSVTALNGVTIYTGRGDTRVSVVSGFYLVTVGSEVCKVLVK